MSSRKPLLDDGEDGYIEVSSFSSSSSSSSSSSYYNSGRSESKKTMKDIYNDKEKLLKLSYEHFMMKGLLNIVIRDVLMILLILTIGAIGTVLIGYTNYSYLYQEGKDGKLFTEYKWDSRGRNALLSILWIPLGPYALFLIFRLVVDLKNHIPVKHFFSKIRIEQGDLEIAEWQDVVQRIKADFAEHYTGKGPQDDELYIMNIIMRDENYLIGLTNAGLLDLSINFPGFLGGRHVFSTDFMYKLLRRTVLRTNYGKGGVENINYEEAEWERELRRRFILHGVLTIVLMPAIFVVLFLYFVTRYGTQAYSDSGSVTKGKWTVHASWSLRHFNEAEHFFTNRLKRGYDSAVAYTDLFPLSSHITWAARYLAYIVGFALVVLIIFTATSPRFVFEVFGISSVTVVSVLTIVFGVLLSLGPKETLKDDFEGKLWTLCVYTEYYPKKWKEHPKSPDTNEEFTAYFKPRVLTWLDEVLSIIFAPYILIAKLPDCAGNIVDFMRDNTDEELKVCKFAMLGTTKDVKSGGNGSGANGNGNGDGDDDSDKMKEEEEEEEFDEDLLCENIVELQEKKSLLCFMRDYPEWTKPANGVRLIRKLSKHLKKKQKTETRVVVNNEMINCVSNACLDVRPAQQSGPSETMSFISNNNNNNGDDVIDDEDAEKFVMNSRIASTLLDVYIEDKKKQN